MATIATLLDRFRHFDGHTGSGGGTAGGGGGAANAPTESVDHAPGDRIEWKGQPGEVVRKTPTGFFTVKLDSGKTTTVGGSSLVKAESTGAEPIRQSRPGQPEPLPPEPIPEPIVARAHSTLATDPEHLEKWETGRTDWGDRGLTNFKEQAEKHGMTFDEYVQATNAHMKEDLSRCEVRLRVSPATLNKVLVDGRFKTQHETYASSGFLDPGFRLNFENEFMGYETPIAETEIINPDYPASAFNTREVFPEDAWADRPIYGYAYPKGEMDVGQQEQYGDCIVVLRDSARAKTTVTYDDSLAAARSLTYRPYVGEGRFGPEYGDPVTEPARAPFLARPIDEPTFACYPKFYGGDPLERPAEDYFGGLGYIEAQVHEGVRVSDIGKVIFRSEPQKATLKKLAAAGIEVELQPYPTKVGDWVVTTGSPGTPSLVTGKSKGMYRVDDYSDSEGGGLHLPTDLVAVDPNLPALQPFKEFYDKYHGVPWVVQWRLQDLNDSWSYAKSAAFEKKYGFSPSDHDKVAELKAHAERANKAWQEFAATNPFREQKARFAKLLVKLRHFDGHTGSSGGGGGGAISGPADESKDLPEGLRKRDDFGMVLKVGGETIREANGVVLKVGDKVSFNNTERYVSGANENGLILVRTGSAAVIDVDPKSVYLHKTSEQVAVLSLFGEQKGRISRVRLGLDKEGHQLELNDEIEMYNGKRGRVVGRTPQGYLQLAMEDASRTNADPKNVTRTLPAQTAREALMTEGRKRDLQTSQADCRAVEVALGEVGVEPGSRWNGLLRKGAGNAAGVKEWDCTIGITRYYVDSVADRSRMQFDRFHTLIHEQLHARSQYSYQDYIANPGMEEGVVEGLSQNVYPEVASALDLGRVIGDMNTITYETRLSEYLASPGARSSYPQYTAPLRTIANFFDMPERDFFQQLHAIPLSERPAWVRERQSKLSADDERAVTDLLIKIRREGEKQLKKARALLDRFRHFDGHTGGGKARFTEMVAKLRHYDGHTGSAGGGGGGGSAPNVGLSTARRGMAGAALAEGQKVEWQGQQAEIVRKTAKQWITIKTADGKTTTVHPDKLTATSAGDVPTRLSSGNLQSVQRLGGGITETYTGVLEDGTKVVVKYDTYSPTPLIGALREQTAYKISQELEIDCPAAVVRELDVEELLSGRSLGPETVAVMEFREGQTPHALMGGGDVWDADPIYDSLPRDEVRRVAMLDRIIGNPDRHAGNSLITDADPDGVVHPIPIDHSLAFSASDWSASGSDYVKSAIRTGDSKLSADDVRVLRQLQSSVDTGRLRLSVNALGPDVLRKVRGAIQDLLDGGDVRRGQPVKTGATGKGTW